MKSFVMTYILSATLLLSACQSFQLINCGISNDFDVELTNNLSRVDRIEKVESSEGRSAYEKYFKSIKPRLRKRVVRKLKSLLRDKR